MTTDLGLQATGTNATGARGLTRLLRTFWSLVVVVSSAAVVVGFGSVGSTAASPPICFGEPITIRGGAGPDVLVGTSGRDVIWGGGGNDILRGRQGSDIICGGPGKDEIDGGLDGDRVIAGLGADQVWDRAGQNFVSGGGGPDRIRTSQEDAPRVRKYGSFIRGGPGADQVWTGRGRDSLWGGEGNDKLSSGGASWDQLYGGPGQDVLHGGAGFDVFHMLGDGDVVDGGLLRGRRLDALGGGVDYGHVERPVTVDLRAGTGSLSGTVAVDRFTRITSIEGSQFEDRLDGDYRLNVIEGGRGDDTILGRGGVDRLIGSGGADTIFGGGGADEISGGGGNDYLDAGEPHSDPDPDFIQGDNGTDTCLNVGQTSGCEIFDP